MTGSVETRALAFWAMVTAACVALPAHAAEIFVEGPDRIVIEGDLFAGDAARFDAVAAPFSAATVLLRTPGGAVGEGVRIGARVRAAGFDTVIPASTACASGCALIWLAGSERFMEPTSLVGFFGAFGADGTVGPEVAEYLATLGIRPEARVFRAFGGPGDRDLVNADGARALGVSVTDLGGAATDAPGNTVTAADPPDITLSLPDDARWIILQSARTPGALSEMAPDALTVRTRNGFYARVIGPFAEAEARRQLRVNLALPSDAYLSQGQRFLFVVEEEGS